MCFTTLVVESRDALRTILMVHFIIKLNLQIMRHTLTKSSIHILFGTKDKLPLINKELKIILYPQIKYELEIEMKCPVRIINGTENHLHILFYKTRISLLRIF